MLTVEPARGGGAGARGRGGAGAQRRSPESENHPNSEILTLNVGYL